MKLAETEETIRRLGEEIKKQTKESSLPRIHNDPPAYSYKEIHNLAARRNGERKLLQAEDGKTKETKRNPAILIRYIIPIIKYTEVK